VAQFCERHNINRSTFYRRLKNSLVPRPVKLGHASVILLDDERQWLERLRDGEFGTKMDATRLVEAKRKKKIADQTARQSA
jgi:predicted DNA-binding transcriptional regulator AlpA